MKKTLSLLLPNTIPSIDSNENNLQFLVPPKLRRSIRTSKLVSLVYEIQNGNIQVDKTELKLLSRIPINEHSFKYIIENNLEQTLTDIYIKTFKV
jgi:hypothetical protein